jgi:hypothetical protein
MVNETPKAQAPGGRAAVYWQRVEDNALHLGSAPKSRLPLGGTDLTDIKFGVGRFPKKEEFQRFSFSNYHSMFLKIK